jgi:hypothetical protein
VKREAEVIRQVLESEQPRQSNLSSSITYASPTALQPLQGLEGIPEDGTMTLDSLTPPVSATTTTSNSSAQNNTGSGLFGTFGGTGNVSRQNSIATTTSNSSMSINMGSISSGRDFWDSIDQKMTPPPVGFSMNLRGAGGYGRSASEDVMMESPTVAGINTSVFGVPVNTSAQSDSRASTPQPTTASLAQLTPVQTPSQSHGQGSLQNPPTAAEGLRKNNKRRRDDDLDMFSLKRRAVSPGVSVQNSPILAQSPVQRNNDVWGQPRLSREGSVVGNSSGSGGNGGDLKRSNSVSSQINAPLSATTASTPSLGPKRLGLQGMNDMQGLTEKMTLE